MGRTEKAKINPEVLAWARKTARRSIKQAAKRADVAPEAVKAWETGEDRPSFAKLRKLAELYKRPTAVFFLPDVPKSFSVVMRDFRRRDDRDISPELAVELRRAEARREFALEMAQEEEAAPSAFNLRCSVEDDPEETAARLRRWLRVSPMNQRSASDATLALELWKQAAERRDVLVFEMKGIDVADTRGFAIAGKHYPVVGLNGADSHTGRIFSLGHELTHLMLNQSGICEYFQRSSGETGRIERFCNRVSAALLLPRTMLATDTDFRSPAGDEHWHDGLISRIAARYKVSREMTVLRLHELGKVSRAHVDEHIRKYQAFYRRERAKKQGGGPTQAYLAVKRNGAPLTRMVLAAYSRDAITVLPRSLSDGVSRTLRDGHGGLSGQPFGRAA